ncbi:hypothetical protein QFZ53_002790 [Microbacterium natoriense]|uniref:Uncharacterized protein n=1 Tax=Microbacterium natoriense TaxID=284570 RepID=A0AAW8F0D8_9MICO|nr:hypothetical protein [Microbacterium natoriense]MDQ0648594.1 hypothetical protein [Microbacterium natoriense]
MYELFGIAALLSAIAVSVAIAIGRWLPPRVVPEYWISLVTWGAQLLVSMVAVFWIGFLGISTPHCAPNCEWDLLGLNFRGFMIAAGLIQVISMVLIVLMRRRRQVRLVPVFGIALTLILFALSAVIAHKAMLFF